MAKRGSEPFSLIDGGDHWIVPTTTGPEAIVDKADGELVGQYRWRVVLNEMPHRPVVKDATGSQWSMAHMLLGERTKVIYADGNGLNNRRSNILTPKKIPAAVDGVVEVPLTKGKVALIDEVDLPLIREREWYTTARKGYYYASTQIDGVSVDMVKILLPESRRIVYLNGNQLDNRRVNLHVCPIRNVSNEY